MNRTATIAALTLAATAGLAAPAMAAQDAPELWAKDVTMKVVNDTDRTVYSYYRQQFTAIAPGESITKTGNNTPSVTLYGEPATRDSGLYADITVFNPEMGFPYTSVQLGAGGEGVKTKQTQGENEKETVAAVNGIEVIAHRHADDDFKKQYTIYLNKTSNADVTVDNTASTRNTYLRVDGQLSAVRKGEKAQATKLQRGKDSTIHVQNGDRSTEMYVAWKNNRAVLTDAQGRSARLDDGQSAKFGFVNITRTDQNVKTAFTFEIR